jgi:hypothetical protein
VKLTVENSYNTVIATPVDENMLSGLHESFINTTGWLEGVYFYTLEFKDANNNSYYKKTQFMMMIK